MQSSLPLRCCAVAAALACIAAPSRAGVMLSPASVLGTDLGTYDTATPLENLINQSGLDKPFTSGVTDFDEYFTTGDPPYGQGAFNLGWQSNFSFNLPLSGYVDFNLGAAYEVSGVAIWNRSIQNAQILVSSTPGGPWDVAATFTLQNRLNFPFSYLPETIDFDGVHQAQYVRLQIDSTYLFDPSDTFAYATIGEVVFDVADAAPGLIGDFDDDGDVDGDDLTIWKGEFGGGAGADADSDGDSDGDDFLIWQRQLGATGAQAAIAAVPEPASCLLGAGAVVTTLCLRRRRFV